MYLDHFARDCHFYENPARLRVFGVCLIRWDLKRRDIGNMRECLWQDFSSRRVGILAQKATHSNV